MTGAATAPATAEGVKTTWPDLKPAAGCALASEKEFRAWCAAAAPRDRFVYAVGAHLPRNPDLGILKASRAAQALGLVLFVQIPEATVHGRKEIRFLAVRSSAALPVAKGKGA